MLVLPLGERPNQLCLELRLLEEGEEVVGWLLVLQHVPLVHDGGEVGRAEARPTDVRTFAPCLAPS